MHYRIQNIHVAFDTNSKVNLNYSQYKLIIPFFYIKRLIFFTSKVTTHNHVTFCAPGNTLTHIEFEDYQIDYLGYHF